MANMANAAPEWQAGSLGRRSKELMVVCPLEGLVRSVAPRQTTYARLRIVSSTHADHGVANGIVCLPWRR